MLRMPSARAPRITRSAISPRLAIRTELSMGFSRWSSSEQVSDRSRPLRSHPEDAVVGLRNRRVGGGLEADPEHAAGVDGVDHAVVPDPGGGEVRRALDRKNVG